MVINIKYNYLRNHSAEMQHFIHSLFQKLCKPTIHAILESANHVAAAQCKKVDDAE